MTTTIENLIEEWERASDGKIGRFARLSLTFVLEKNLLTDEEIGKFQSVDGTKEILGFRLSNEPLLLSVSTKQDIKRFWKESVSSGIEKYFLNSQWFEWMRDLFMLWLRNVLMRQPGEKNNAPSAGFEKKIDWSMFQHGMSLPNAFHEAALAHLSSPLPKGTSQKVRLDTDGGVFEAKIRNVQFSNGCTRDVIQILWGNKSPIAQYFQSKYKTLFEAMVRDDDKSVIDALTARVMIECADEKGVFRICSIGSEEKSDIINVHKANEQKAYEEKTVVKKAEARMQSASSKNLAADIRRHYPNGFDFSDNAMRLVESRCGSLSQKETAVVQRMMYKQMCAKFFKW